MKSNLHTLTLPNARGFAAAFLLLFGAFPGVAEEFPKKTVKVVVPFKPGGASDVLARTIQEGLRQTEGFDRGFAILNIGGAGGTIGSRRVKAARPDGYTILNLHDAILTAKYTGQCEFGPEAFVPIAATGAGHTVLCISPSGRWRGLRDLLEQAKKTPRSVSFGMNRGAPSEVIGRLVESQLEGVEFQMIGCRGGADRYEKMLGGLVDVSIFSVSEYLRFRATEDMAGLRPLCYLGPERHPKLGGTPTAKEEGFDLVTGTTQYWWAPKGTPEERVAKLGEMLEAAMNSAYVKKRFEQESIEPIFLRGEALAADLAEKEAQLRDLKLTGERSAPNLNLPPILGVCALIFAVLAAIFGLRKGFPTGNRPENTLTAFILGGLLVVYVGLLSLRGVPFWLLTLFFVAGAGFLLTNRDRSVKTRGILAGLAILLAVGLSYLFQNVLIIDLP